MTMFFGFDCLSRLLVWTGHASRLFNTLLSSPKVIAVGVYAWSSTLVPTLRTNSIDNSFDRLIFAFTGRLNKVVTIDVDRVSHSSVSGYALHSR